SKGVRRLPRRHAHGRRVRASFDWRRVSGQLEWLKSQRSFRPHPQNHAAEQAWPSDATAGRRRPGFDRIRKTMPQSKPGRLTRQQDADVLAFLLNINKFPAGKTELYRQSEMLKEIRFEAKKPAKN